MRRKKTSDERAVKDIIRLWAGSLNNVRLFTNPVGIGYLCTTQYPKRNSTVTLINPRLIAFGLHVGSSDLIGWRSVTITKEMIGMKLAQFVSLEVKDGGKTTAEQKIWIDNIRQAGGCAAVVHDVEETRIVLAEKWTGE